MSVYCRSFSGCFMEALGPGTGKKSAAAVVCNLRIATRAKLTETPTPGHLALIVLALVDHRNNRRIFNCDRYTILN